MCGSAPLGLDVAGALAALDGPGAEAAAEDFLERACELECTRALDGEIEYHIARLAEEGQRSVDEVTAKLEGEAP
jgi:hypothetical protein